MTSPTTGSTERKAFISSLTLPNVPGALRGLAQGVVRFRGAQPNAAVDAGSVVSFVGGIEGQSRADVLNSVLLAQLASDKKYDREKDPKDWYSFYVSVLRNAGWVAQAATLTEYNAGGKNLDVDKAILEILGAIATQNELTAIKAAIDGAKALADGDGRITIFDHFAAKSNAGMFQVGAASEQDGAVALKLGTFSYTSQNSITKVLWFKFSSKDTELSYSSQAITLNSSVYSQVRSAVEQKLSDNAKLFIANLDV